MLGKFSKDIRFKRIKKGVNEIFSYKQSIHFLIYLIFKKDFFHTLSREEKILLTLGPIQIKNIINLSSLKKEREMNLTLGTMV
jgi:hypothetical protein